MVSGDAVVTFQNDTWERREPVFFPVFLASIVKFFDLAPNAHFKTAQIGGRNNAQSFIGKHPPIEQRPFSSHVRFVGVGRPDCADASVVEDFTQEKFGPAMPVVLRVEDCHGVFVVLEKAKSPGASAFLAFFKAAASDEGKFDVERVSETFRWPIKTVFFYDPRHQRYNDQKTINVKCKIACKTGEMMWGVIRERIALQARRKR